MRHFGRSFAGIYCGSAPGLARLSGLLLGLLCLLLLQACGGRQAHQPHEAGLPSWMGTVEDLRRFPQDLNGYAARAGKDKELFSAAEQSAQVARFMRIYFGPWEMTKTSVSRRDAAAIFHRARGFKYDDVRWTQEEWDAISRNAAMGAFPSRSTWAITVRATDLREMPTSQTRFAEPTPDPRANPFDYFQYSLLPVGTPLLIAHTTRDGRWHFVECPIAAGWVAADDVAAVDAAFAHTYRDGPFAALVRDPVRLVTAGGTTATAGIGALLPLRNDNQNGQDDMRVLLPQRGPDGMARTEAVTLAAADAAPWPLPPTPGNIARLGNRMMGQHYGWGGMFGLRDCSAMTRDLLAPFGIWLPRNSVAQARTGSVLPLEGMSTAEKEAAILRYGVPFLSLVGMRGHITLYVGNYRGRPAILHDVWGVRVVQDGDDDARLVLGRVVITSITPGAELPNLDRTVTFADRLRTLSTPADTLR